MTATSAPGTPPVIGIIGGSGVYDIPGLTNVVWRHVPPTELNFRANIDALKRSGVTEIISVSAVGSLREDLPPGTFVVVDQFIDRTFARVKSFFEKGCV